MRFSVVAPNLNEMPYLETWFLRSLAAQTFKDFEVIVVDGGSTDGSLEALTKYQKLLNLNIITDPKRNIGYIRNIGCKHAQGDILLNTSCDIYFEPSLLKRLDLFFEDRPELLALGGRTIPKGSRTPFVTHIGHGGFDILRFLMSCKFMPVRKIRPNGNLFAIKRDLFQKMGGYPEVKINEDGLLGYKLDKVWKFHGHKACYYSLKFKVYHHVKRFEKKGGLSGILFYIYVFRMVFPFLTPLLMPIERLSGEKFADR